MLNTFPTLFALCWSVLKTGCIFPLGNKFLWHLALYCLAVSDLSKYNTKISGSDEVSETVVYQCCQHTDESTCHICPYLTCWTLPCLACSVLKCLKQLYIFFWKHFSNTWNFVVWQWLTIYNTKIWREGSLVVFENEIPSSLTFTRSYWFLWTQHNFLPFWVVA
jgi:hypothetical protein